MNHKLLNVNLIEDFSYLEDWESKYSYLIALGKMLPPMDSDKKNDYNKVAGCMSNVWMCSCYDNSCMQYEFSSDALIVQGLCAVLYILFNHKTPEEIYFYDLEKLLNNINLIQHITPNRRAGFFSLTRRVKDSAYNVLSSRKS